MVENLLFAAFLAPLSPISVSQDPAFHPDLNKNFTVFEREPKEK